MPRCAPPTVVRLLAGLAALALQIAGASVVRGDGDPGGEVPHRCGTCSPIDEQGGGAAGPDVWGWEFVPGVIRGNGTDECRLEVTTSFEVQAVRLTSLNFYFELPGVVPVSLHDDGKDGDLLAGDKVFTVAGIRTRYVPDHFRHDPTSPDGLGIQDIGTIQAVRQDGTVIEFMVRPDLGVLRPDVPLVAVTQVSSSVAISPHLINVRGSERITQRTLRSMSGSLGGEPNDLTIAMYSVLPDAFDFLVLFSMDRVELTPRTSSANFTNGLHYQVRTNFTGTGQQVHDYTRSYGSGGRLLSVNFMDVMSRGIDGYLVTHEILHQWGAFISPAFGVSDGSHYSHLSSAGSLLGGTAWVDLGDGTFLRACAEGRSAGGAFHAAPIDLYLMGLIPGSEVPPLRACTADQLACDSVVLPPYSIATIEQIQAAHGVRTPGPEGAQRQFRIGFVAESKGRFLDRTEMTYYDILAGHYTKALSPAEPDPFVSQHSWPSISRFYGHGTTWASDVPNPRDDVIVDDGDFGTWAAGSWLPSGGPNPHDGDSVYSKEANAVYGFTAALPSTGSWEVFLWWTEYPSRLAGVPVEVHTADGMVTLTVDQRTAGGRWNSLGVFRFGTTGYVHVRSPGGGTACADAVRFARVEDVPPPSSDLVLDDGDPGTTAAGAWSCSGGVDPWQGDSYYSKQAGATYAYRFGLATPGAREVFLWWTEYPSRLVSVPVEIAHAGGVSTVTVDQTTGGGRWNSVGVYSFGSSATVTIRSLGPGTTCADAVRLAETSAPPPPPPPPGDLVMDDGDPGTTAAGAWSRSGGVDPWEGDSYYSKQAGATYAYRFGLATPGAREVFLWWTEYPIRLVSVPVEIAHAGGVSTVTIDQTTGGGRWNSVGVYSFGSSATVTIRSLGPGTTCADAVRLAETNSTPPPPPPPPAEIIQDDGDPGTSASGLWLPSGGSDPYGGDSLYSKQVGATYGYRFEGLAAARYEVFAWWTEYPSRPAAVPIEILGSTGTDTVTVDQRSNGGRWVSLGTFGSTGTLVVRVRSPGGGSTCADAVKIVPKT